MTINITRKNTAQGLCFIQNYIIGACPHTMNTFIIFNTFILHHYVKMLG